jgi:hypothetical protein
LIAAGVVVALALGGTWWFKWRDKGPLLDGALLQELTNKPDLSPVLQVNKVLKGDFDTASFMTSSPGGMSIDLEPATHPLLLDQDTVVAYGQSYGFFPAVQVAAVNARAGKIRWRVDVLKALGDAWPVDDFGSAPYPSEHQLVPDGNGGLLVSLSTSDTAVTLQIDGAGKKVAIRPDAAVVAVAGDLVVFERLIEGQMLVSVATLSDMRQDLWQAPLWGCRTPMAST